MRNEIKLLSPQLPWDQLAHTEGNIPWDVLDTFVDALSSDPLLWEGLAKIYNLTEDLLYEYRGFEEFYVPAIFIMSADSYTLETRLDIADFLLGKLSEAGFEDMEITMEILTGACGALGPEILPLVLEAIDDEPDCDGAWPYLWSLTKLAVDCKNEFVKKRVIKACEGMLDQLDRGEVNLLDAIGAADTLARLGLIEHQPKMLEILEKTKNDIGKECLEEIVEQYEENPKLELYSELWKRPVKEWIVPYWKRAEKWYSENAPGDVGQDFDDFADRRSRLAIAFGESSEAKKMSAELHEDASFIASCILDMSYDYLDCAPEDIDENVLCEVLLEIFPRKISDEDSDIFEKVAPVAEVFIKWLGKDDIISDADELAETIGQWGDQIVANGMNPLNWGVAKNIMMQALHEGIDIEDDDAMNDYLTKINDLHRQDEDFIKNNPYTQPMIPIKNIECKVGRNDSCPCGSGKKYKKCCENTSSMQTEIL